MESLIKKKWVIPEENVRKCEKWLKISDEQWIKDLINDI